MPILEMKQVCKSYVQGAERQSVLKDVDLVIEEGEFVALVGFSGSGKTTLISTLAGLIAPDSGEVLFKGKPVTGASPERAAVFQSYSLMPWLSVPGKVALAVDAFRDVRRTGTSDESALTRQEWKRQRNQALIGGDGPAAL